MKLPSTIRFADKKIKDAFFKLEQGDDSQRELFKFISQALDNIEENSFCGTQIPKKLIPSTYRKNKFVKNLWKYDLPKGWRLLYVVVNEEILVVSILLEWLSHKDYEKRFRY